MVSKNPVERKGSTLLLITGILLLASNFRAPFTSVAPVLRLIQDDYGLSATQAGLLSATPLFVFALLSPFAARIARRVGLERALFGSMIVLAVGAALRSSGPLYGAIVGTLLVGAGICVGNVMIPGLLKKQFPESIGAMTALYALAMAITSAIGSAVAVPIAEASAAGWRASLGIFVILALVSALVWSPQLRGAEPGVSASDARQSSGPPLWKSPLAWQTTLFFGLNSCLYYIIISWAPTILVDSGYSEEAAGNVHGLMQLFSGLAGLILMPLMARLRDQRILAASTAGILVIGLLGLITLPQFGAVWAVLLGFGGGAVFVLALAFIGLRASTPDQAASLSGMAQSVGYLLATTGPTLIGKIHDVRGDWTLALSLCVGLAWIVMSFGLLAGRDRTIGGDASI